MNHIVYLDHKANELENLKSGEKTMIIRGAMGRRTPYGEVSVGDILYFIENKGDGLIKGAAEVKEVFNSGKLTKEESAELIEKHQDKLMLDTGLLKRFSGKRYIELFTITNFEVLEPFAFDRSKYPKMDDWLLVEDMETIKAQKT
ncbi:hypothetical protein [Flagellimonas lutaonensis]|uniref:ASCH domain-containing protein n=1 Tax=Flagellimonas lutaonensis TaxID=516051 RepID=A0A0D5YPX0_9FLAO|nr:hypothetical protein [Allomuricauda lutaonensis]AKA34282.1 hypothetical protein VC82_610 [Allomuricauda lutaonensis]